MNLINAVSGLKGRFQRLTRPLAVFCVTAFVVVGQPGLAFAAKPKKPKIQDTPADWNFPVLGKLGVWLAGGMLLGLGIAGLFFSVAGLISGVHAVRSGKPSGKSWAGLGLGVFLISIAVAGTSFFFGLGNFFTQFNPWAK